jgi:hypothetical protein
MSIVNLFHTLIHIIQPELQKTTAQDFPVAVFTKKYRDYHDFQRLGGTLHHLHKYHPIINRSILQRNPSSCSVTKTTLASETSAPTIENADNQFIEIDNEHEVIDMNFELFDNALLLFHLMMSKKLAKATEIFMRQEQLKRQLEECRVQLDVAMKEKVRLLKGLNNKTKEYFRKTTMSTFSLSLSPFIVIIVKLIFFSLTRMNLAIRSGKSEKCTH